jgi:hypothetical protein
MMNCKIFESLVYTDQIVITVQNIKGNRTYNNMLIIIK